MNNMTAHTAFAAAKRCDLSMMTPGAIVDFGVDGYGGTSGLLRFLALCTAVKEGATLEDFIRVACDGEAIEDLVKEKVPTTDVPFRVIYDDIP